MNSEDDDNEQTNFISYLRTTIILAARNSSSSDIEIAAIDKIVETTIDFIKNILEQMANENNLSSFSSFDLLNTIRVRSIFIIIYLNRIFYFIFLFSSLIHI
jgi:hypothetical protein